MPQLPTTLTTTETRNVEALTRAMGDRHLTKTQRLELAAMIGGIFDQATTPTTLTTTDPRRPVMGTDTTDLTSAEEIIASDYAHDEASPELPWAANRVLNELGRVRGELTEYGEKYVTAQRELERLRARVAELEADVRGTAAARDSWRAETLAHRAELEAGETRTEWGVRRGDEEDEEMSFYGEAEQAAREFAAYPPVEGYRVEKRKVHTSPWVPVEDEAGA